MEELDEDFRSGGNFVDPPCHVHVNNKAMRGEPCPGTYKYMTVTFTCVQLTD